MDMESPLDCTSTNFEKVALSKFFALSRHLPHDIKIFREPWGSSTVLCIDFERCPHLFPMTPKQNRFIAAAIAQLGLTNSVIFRVGNRILGWKKIKLRSEEREI